MSYDRDRERGGRNDCRIYVGNLPPDIRSKDVEDLFDKYGKITMVDLKNRQGPPFAFVEFDDPRDAEDAIKHRDGYDYDGYRIRVEFPRGQGRGGGGSGSGGFRGGSAGRGRGTFNNVQGNRRTNHKVLVTGLPSTGSWQDLKDHMREAGDVCYTDVFKDGSGVVEFLRYEDMKYALRKLDDTKFRSHEGETSYIHVKEYTSEDHERERDFKRDRAANRSSDSRGYSGRRGSTDRGRSPPPRRSRASPTYSPAKGSSRSRSNSRSRSSRSRSRSGSRST